MADNNRESERAALYKTLWNMACDFVHGGAVSPNDFKQYVFGMMFYRFISENIANYINNLEHEAGNKAFNYADFDDESAKSAKANLVDVKGFFILPSQLFCNLQKRAKKDENLNTTIESIFRAIEDSAKGTDSESDFKGLFDDFDVNSNSLGKTVAKRNEMLCKLLDGVASMELSINNETSIDAFGDAYEY